MKLTQEQKDMLDGKYGKGTAYAMKIQVAIGESFDAEKDGSYYEGPCRRFPIRKQISGFVRSF